MIDVNDFVCMVKGHQTGFVLNGGGLMLPLIMKQSILFTYVCLFTCLYATVYIFLCTLGGG